MASVNSPQPKSAEELGPQPEELSSQPDVKLPVTGPDQVTAGLQQAGTELAKFSNLPPIAQAAAIMEQMQQMQQQMQQNQEQMQQNHQAMQNEMQQLRGLIATSYQTTAYNSIARIENSAIRRSDAPLTALRSFTTNADIPGFPTTPAQLWNMTDPTLDPILTALDLPITGQTEEKKQRLRFYIGLVDIY